MLEQAPKLVRWVIHLNASKSFSHVWVSQQRLIWYVRFLRSNLIYFLWTFLFLDKALFEAHGWSRTCPRRLPQSPDPGDKNMLELSGRRFFHSQHCLYFSFWHFLPWILAKSPLCGSIGRSTLSAGRSAPASAVPAIGGDHTPPSPKKTKASFFTGWSPQNRGSIKIWTHHCNDDCFRWKLPRFDSELLFYILKYFTSHHYIQGYNI